MALLLVTLTSSEDMGARMSGGGAHLGELMEFIG